MTSLAEVQRSLVGAWRLFWRDPSGLGLFDLSFEGFLRSFGAILLVLPFYVFYLEAELVLLAATEAVEILPARGWFYAWRCFGLLLDWLAYPLLMILVARSLDLSGRYVPYIVAYNWANVIVIVPVALPQMLFAAGVLPLGAATLLTLVVFGAVLHYRWYLARVALGASGMTALGLVALDVLLSLVLTEAVNRAIGL